MSDYISKQEAIQKVTEVELQDGTFADAKIKIGAIKTLNEKEIIRKAFERVVERLEEEERTLQDKYERNLKKEYDDPFVSGRLCELECVIEIAKKEGRLNV